MNGPEIQKLIDEDLRRGVAGLNQPPEQQLLRASPWMAMSALQKAIRRGRKDLAQAAAATLLSDAPERLWRRLACTAAEDVGLGSPAAVGVATAALGGKRKRAELGGEWAVACSVIAELVAAPKCRAADDLLMMCDLHPGLKRQRSELIGLNVRDLTDLAIGDGEIERRAMALSAALTGDPRGSGKPRPRRQTDAVFDYLCEAGWPQSMVEVARLNFHRTGTMLAPLVALPAREAPQDAHIESEITPPEITIAGAPSWAFDFYSREGRAALSKLRQGDSPTALWLRRHAPPSRRLAVLGHCVFRVEGGVLDQRLRWPLSDRRRYEVDVACAGVAPDEAVLLLELVHADIPELNRIREAMFAFHL